MPHGDGFVGTEDFGGSDYPICPKCNDRGWFEADGLHQSFGVVCECQAGVLQFKHKHACPAEARSDCDGSCR